MSPTADQRINTVIADKYLIERRIARGGMGSVYLATHELMNRKVAIKLLHEKLHQEDKDDVFFKRFLREARAASKLNHPNAVTIYDFGLADGIPYLAMQYIDGKNISALLAQDGPFTIERSLPLFEQICSAMQAAHELTIAHRDIKPDNIIIQINDLGKETAHVLDFGIAKAMVGSATMVGAMTAVGKTVGTPRYMSPEQALGQEVDLRTDVYSLAIVFYEMLVGDIPFSAATPVELMYEHLNTEPKAIPAELGLPKSFQTALFKAMSKSPEDRYSSPAEMVAALKRSLDPEQESQVSLGLFRVKPKQLFAGAIMLTAVLILSAVFSSNSNHIDPDPLPSTEPLPTTEPSKLEQQGVQTSNTDTSNTDTSNSQALNTQDLDTPDSNDQKLEALPQTAVSEFAENQPQIASQEDLITGHRPIENVEQDFDQQQSSLAEKKEDEQEQNEQISNTEQLALSQKSVSSLIEDLGSENREQRINAAIELQKRGKKPIPQLINSLRTDQSPRVRYLCAFILGKMKAQEAAPALRVATQDESGMVAETAKRALVSLGR